MTSLYPRHPDAVGAVPGVHVGGRLKHYAYLGSPRRWRCSGPRRNERICSRKVRTLVGSWAYRPCVGNASDFTVRKLGSPPVPTRPRSSAVTSTNDARIASAVTRRPHPSRPVPRGMASGGAKLERNPGCRLTSVPAPAGRRTGSSWWADWNTHAHQSSPRCWRAAAPARRAALIGTPARLESREVRLEFVRLPFGGRSGAGGRGSIQLRGPCRCHVSGPYRAHGRWTAGSRGCWRRSTASSWRKTRISISLASVDRKHRTISSRARRSARQTNDQTTRDLH